MQTTRSNGRRALALAWMAAAASGGAGGQGLSGPVNGIEVVQAPEAAQVGVGDGTAFTVQVRTEPGVSVLGYQWRRNGRALPRGGDKPVWSVTVGSRADAGDITVDVIGSRGTVTTAPVRLDVVSAGWAPLGGRPMAAAGVALQAPSLAHCNDPHLAWVQLAGGQGRVQVHRFDGQQWQRVGAAGQVNDAGSDGGEPSLQCSQEGGTWPVVAYSQSAGSGRAVGVRRFDGTDWRNVGSVPAPPDGQARAPLLRLVPSDNDYGDAYAPQHIVGGSMLAWLDRGTVRSARWSSLSWLGGPSSGQDVRAHDLVVDTALRGPQGRLFPKLLGQADHPVSGLAQDRWQPHVQTESYGPWTGVGAPPALPAPSGVAVRVRGLGFAATENSRPRVVVLWSQGDASYALKSATLWSTDYEDAMSPASSLVAWQPYAVDFTGTGLLATAFDPQAQEPLCTGAAAPFALALTDSRGTRVLRADCAQGGLPVWRAQGGVLPRVGRALGLRYQGPSTPLLASVEDGPKGAQLTVWKLYP